jgi:hypothetical protein
MRLKQPRLFERKNEFFRSFNEIVKVTDHDISYKHFDSQSLRILIRLLQYTTEYRIPLHVNNIIKKHAQSLWLFVTINTYSCTKISPL